jgi:hypothetical protein
MVVGGELVGAGFVDDGYVGGGVLVGELVGAGFVDDGYVGGIVVGGELIGAACGGVRVVGDAVRGDGFVVGAVGGDGFVIGAAAADDVGSANAADVPAIRSRSERRIDRYMWTSLQPRRKAGGRAVRSDDAGAAATSRESRNSTVRDANFRCHQTRPGCVGRVKGRQR